MNKKLFFSVIIVSGFFFACQNTDATNRKQGSERSKKAETIEEVYELIPEVAAKVNNVEIRKDRVKIALNAAITQYRLMGEIMRPDENEIIKTILDNLIQEELIYQQKTPLNISIPDHELEKELSSLKKRFPSEEAFVQSLKKQSFTVDLIRKELKRNMTVRKIIDSQTSKPISFSDKELKEYYTSNQDRFTDPPSVKVSHILIKFDAESNVERKAAKEKIDRLQKQAASGADFADLAKEFSEGPSAIRGGDLGYFSKNKMTPAFEQVAFSLNPGEVSNAFDTPFGYHIIKLFDKKDGSLRPFDEVKDEIKAFFQQKEQIAKTNSWVEQLRKQSSVEIFLPSLNDHS